MSDLLVQIEAFFLTLVLGIVAGFIFHYYQLTIVKARVGKYPLYILDFFLWIIMICLVFFCMLWINQGEMRVYVLLALVSGILIYYYYVASHLQRLVDASATLTVGMVGMIFNGVKKPTLWAANRIKILLAKKPPPPDEND